MSTVRPNKNKFRITNWGVHFGENKYQFSNLVRFWFSERNGYTLLQLETDLRFPRVIPIIIDPKDRDKIKEIMVKRMVFSTPAPNTIEKLTTWFAQKLPLEDRK
jgi:hypothetical protein